MQLGGCKRSSKSRCCTQEPFIAKNGLKKNSQTHRNFTTSIIAFKAKSDTISRENLPWAHRPDGRWDIRVKMNCMPAKTAQRGLCPLSLHWRKKAAASFDLRSKQNRSVRPDQGAALGERSAQTQQAAPQMRDTMDSVVPPASG